MDNYEGRDRRTFDPVQKQIEDLILAAVDPKDKAFLLIINKIALSLDTNTHLTQGLVDDVRDLNTAFRKHERDDSALLNQASWQLYRQALRDITEQAGYPEDIVWPATPE